MRKFYVFLTIVLLSVSGCKPKDDFEKLASLDVPLGTPQSGEWLAEHKESGQTFEQYKKLKPFKVTKNSDVIYIQPIGDFNEKENKILDLTVEYLSFFYGVKTEKLKPVSDKIVPEEKRRLNEMNAEQLDASYILDSIMPKVKPKNALVTMGLSAKDLYPKPSWNFVFGLATYSKGVGVTSFFRYEPNLPDYRICLRRTIRTSAHEIGHMFKMKHCTYAKCVMNGVNSLSEDDRKPNTLCSVCLKKMHLNFGFDMKVRFQKLLNFYRKHGLTEDEKIILEQFETIKE
ncbi:archaemetzincin [Flavobacterium sp. H122]|uniref:archaemetzincin n=1 Tax=Flavobacterium sp. H122 TaxID=2529860 RepID=UPI0010AA32FB|nr:archaemetzincin [Flavobacterium sp. H122]